MQCGKNPYKFGEKKAYDARLAIDGENWSFDRPLTVEQLLERIGLDGRKVAVEPNRDILQKSNYTGVGLHDGDKLVVVHFVEGGRSDGAPFVVIDEPLVFADKTDSSRFIIWASR